MTRSSTLLSGAVFLLACTRPQTGSGATADAAADASDEGEPSAAQILDEQKRIQNGEDVAASMRAPKIVVDKSGLEHNGKRLIARTALPTTLATIEPLLVRLKRDREHWKRLYPGALPPGTPDVLVDADIDARTLAALMKTAASAGYTKPTVRVGSTKISPVWNDYARAKFEDLRVTVLPKSYELRFEGGDCAPHKRLRRAANDAELRSAIEDALLCRERAAGFGLVRGPDIPSGGLPPVDVVVVETQPGATAADAVGALEKLLALPCLATSGPRVDLETAGPAGKPDTRDAGACP
jgi:hypothetical protein